LDAERTASRTQIEAKDTLLVASAEHMTSAMLLSAKSNEELRRVIEENVRTKQELKVAIDQLRISMGQLPCQTVEEAEKNSAHRR
jgi:hypothetical protein